MGFNRPTAATFRAAHSTYVPQRGPATRVAEERVRKTGKLDPLVDPAEYGVIRRSLIRFEERPDGLYAVTIGLSIPIEVRLDTTGSMGDNVDRAIKVLPDTYALAAKMLPGCDPHLAIGIFADCMDNFVLCRPQFEMTAERLTHQLTLMFPEGGGYGNGGEDPQYGLFGAAYLTAAYCNRIGIKGFDFTITDEPARHNLSERQLVRVFGPDVFDKVKQNGFDISKNELPSTKQVINDLQKRAHAFILLVGDRYDAARFWPTVIDESRIIRLPHVELLPQVQASIIGLTHGTLSLQELEPFLRESGVANRDADAIVRSVANIPITPYTAAELDILARAPKAGDVFRTKTDLWPMDPSEVPALPEPEEFEAPAESGPEWL